MKQIALLILLFTFMKASSSTESSSMLLNMTYTLTPGTCLYNADELTFDFSNFTDSDLTGDGITRQQTLTLSSCNRSDDSMSSSPAYATHSLFIQDSTGANIDTQTGIPLGLDSTASGLILQLSMWNPSSRSDVFFGTQGVFVTGLPNPLTLTARISKDTSHPSYGGTINTRAWLVIEYK